MLGLFGVALGAWFEDATDEVLGSTAGWTNEVLLDDLDGDGDLDIALANGGNYNTPGAPEANVLLRNDGAGGFSAWSLPGGPDLARSIAAGDLDGDGWPDLIVGATYQTASRLFLGDGEGFTEASDALPDGVLSVGDLALGDLDLDGDLDVVLADWGPGDPLSNAGGVTRLWRNDGGTFTDVTAAQMPDLAIGMAWDLELADVDGDFDLDVLVASKTGPGSALLRNDGGTFTDASAGIPAFTNNYVMAPMDVDGDGDLDVVTSNDGAGLRDHLLLGDGTGVFTVAPWPNGQNPPEDDNAVVFADLDDDGDPDVVIGSLSGADRVALNDGAGGLTLRDERLLPGPTPGTLALAIGDVDGDGRPDVLMGQGEVAYDDRFYRGVDVPADTHAPVIVAHLRGNSDVRARVHDRSTPIRPSDLSVRWVVDGASTPLVHAGGDVWRAELPTPDGQDVALCAVDRAGNEACVQISGSPADTDTDPPKCGCRTGGGSGALALFGLLALRRRQPPRQADAP